MPFNCLHLFSLKAASIAIVAVAALLTYNGSMGLPTMLMLDMFSFMISVSYTHLVEWEVSNGAYLYLASGDIMLDSFATENNHCSFPVSHYHGITVTISVPEAVEGLSDFLSMFSIDLEQIEQQFTLKTRPFIMHGNSVPDHVISELYQVPENIRLEYLRVKVLELLVTLRTVDPTVLGVERPYFYKTQVEKVKAIMSFMTNEPEHHFTMEIGRAHV